MRRQLHTIDFENRSLHCVKSGRIRSFSGPHFTVIGLNTERYRVSLRIQSECGKIRTIITPNTDTFHTLILIQGKCNRVDTSRVSTDKFAPSHFTKWLELCIGCQQYSIQTKFLAKPWRLNVYIISIILALYSK